MNLPVSFVNYILKNRLGQSIQLAVNHIHEFGRDYVFVASLTHQSSSVVAKNAVHFAFQLRELFDLDSRRFDMIELRGDAAAPSLWRWRFEWVGASPLSPRSEAITSQSQQAQLLNLLNMSDAPQAALG